VKLTGPMRDLALDASLATPDGGSIAARGTLDLASQQKGYDLATTMHLFDASAVSTKAPRTSLSADATVRGAGFDPATMHAVATAKVRTSMYDSVAVDSAMLRASAAGGMLTLDTLMLRIPAGRADLAGTFGLAQPHVGTLRYAVFLDSLSTLERFMPSSDTAGSVPPRPGILAARQARASRIQDSIATRTEVERAVTGARAPQIPVDTPRAVPRSRLAGTVQAQGTATGNIHTFNLNGTASGQNVVALGNTAKSFSARYAWNSAFTPQSRVSADVTAVQLVAGGFALDTVTLSTAYQKPNGTVKLAIRQDSSRYYTLNAAYVLNKQRNDLILDNLRLRFDTVTYASAHPSRIHFGPAGVQVDSFDIRSPHSGQIYVNGQIPTSGNADVEIDVTQFDIGNLLALAQSDIPAHGLVSVAMHASGTRAAPVMSGAFGVERFTYGTRATPELHGRFSYANQTLTTNLDAMREGGPVIANANGTVPINLALAGVTGSRIPRDRTIAATVTSDSLPLELVPQFTDLVANLTGRAYANFTIGGTINNPIVNGRLALWNGGVKVVPLGITLSDVATNIRLQRDTVVIDSLVARSNGPIRLHGGVGIKSLSAPSFDLALTARDARVIDNDMGNMLADANLTMKGPFNDVLVAGTARAVRGVIYIPESNGKTLVGAGDPALFSVLDTAIASQRALFPQQSPLLGGLEMAVGVQVNHDVFVRSSEANVELYTEDPLEISVDRAKQLFVLDGVLLSDMGEYRFQSRRFQIKQGSATFVNTPGLNPTLQITGEYDVQVPSREAIAIRILISGTLDQPKIALESDAQPPISQTDLLSYLAFGRSSTSLLQQEGSGLTTSGTGTSNNIVGQGAAFAAKQVSAAALGALTDQISGQAIRSLGADFFNIEPADVQLDAASFLRGTQVEFGKYIQTRTFLQLQFRPDPTSLQRPGFQLTHRFGGNTGYRIEASLEPRYLLKQPSLSPDVNPTTTSAFGLFLVREWRY
jgi:translocation and assembly module TamB